MSGTAVFKVLRAAPYTAYLMVASTLTIACWTAFIHQMFLGKGELRPLTVIGDVLNFVTGRTPSALTSLSDWLRAEAGMTSVIAVGVFVAGIGLFYLSARDERAVWYGLPTAYIALAGFAEVEPRVALFTGLGAFLLQAFIGGLQMAWDARTPTEGYVPLSGLERLLNQWTVTTAGLICGPLILVDQLKAPRADETRTSRYISAQAEM